MTEQDCYIIEMALNHGFDPHDDGEDSESDTYVVRGDDLVAFVKMLRQTATPWWRFWNPQSGLWGGVLAFVVFAFIGLIIGAAI